MVRHSVLEVALAEEEARVALDAQEDQQKKNWSQAAVQQTFAGVDPKQMAGDLQQLRLEAFAMVAVVGQGLPWQTKAVVAAEHALQDLALVLD